jgi:hypothetical protein
LTTLLDLGNDCVEGGLGEDIGVILHIFLGILISLEQLELEAAEEDGVSEQKVALHIVAGNDGVAVLLALHEITTNATRVLVANFVDLDSVVTAVEGDDETTRLIIRLGGDELRLKSENVHILLEHLLHIDLRRLGLQGVN